MTLRAASSLALAVVLAAAPAGAADPAAETASRLTGAILGPSPMEEDLRQLTDEVGGRVSGTEANRRAVAWAVAALQRAGVDEVHTESFNLPATWERGDVTVEVLGAQPFHLPATSIAWSPATPASGIEAPLLHLGFGTADDFARLGARVKGALVVVDRAVLRTWADLFAEYDDAPPTLERARAAGAAGVLWISTREQGVLYQHINTGGEIDVLPQALVAREDALRAVRFLGTGRELRARLTLKNRVGGPRAVDNVVAEIRGTDRAAEIVAIGAHLDSWELGTGALDNGCNVALVIEVARAMKAAGVRPRRTLRFLLWNGEEQGLLGSWAYARAHREELERFVAYLNIDGGIGRVTGYSLGGRHDILAGVREVVAPLASWNMNAHTLDAGGGTDHVDFLLEGVPTLNANQLEGNYLPHYHASSDTFDKVDLRDLKLHAAYMAVTMAGIANREERLGPRQTRAEVEALVAATGLDKYLKASGKWDAFTKGERGRAVR
jgi:carboxypeptidase Q